MLHLRYSGDLPPGAAVPQHVPLPAGATLGVGRAESSALRLHTSVAISRAHAQLAVSPCGREAFLQSLPARNGTFLNNVRLAEHARVALRAGDEIIFGGAPAARAGAGGEHGEAPLIRHFAYRLVVVGAAASGSAGGVTAAEAAPAPAGGAAAVADAAPVGGAVDAVALRQRIRELTEAGVASQEILQHVVLAARGSAAALVPLVNRALAAGEAADGAAGARASAAAAVGGAAAAPQATTALAELSASKRSRPAGSSNVDPTVEPSKRTRLAEPVLSVGASTGVDVAPARRAGGRLLCAWCSCDAAAASCVRLLRTCGHLACHGCASSRLEAALARAREGSGGAAAASASAAAPGFACAVCAADIASPAMLKHLSALLLLLLLQSPASPSQPAAATDARFSRLVLDAVAPALPAYLLQPSDTAAAPAAAAAAAATAQPAAGLESTSDADAALALQLLASSSALLASRLFATRDAVAPRPPS